MSYTTPSTRWRAVCTRDRSANGLFVYAVHSTRIYCRPTCPARLARRANVDFYDTSAAAEAAGFRACKRCKPEDAVIPDPLAKVVVDACKAIEKAVLQGRTSGEGKITLNEVARTVGLTPRYLHKVFKERMGVTPRQYAESLIGAGGNVGVNQAVGVDSDTPKDQGETFDGLIDQIAVDPVPDFDFNAYADPNLPTEPFNLVAWDLCSDFPSLGDGDIFNQPLAIDSLTIDVFATTNLGLPTPSDSSAGTPLYTAWS